jgi:hypothetical protein
VQCDDCGRGKMNETAVLSLGSNIGDRRKNLRAAMELLKQSGFEIKKASSFYETEPVKIFRSGRFSEYGGIGIFSQKTGRASQADF